MIFVTVGTHEQQFNRLISYVDNMKKNEIDEDIFIQTGYSTYQPENCKWSKLLSYKEMVDMVEKARIVITHGGPSSFIMPLQIGKLPIVVPRKKEFNEHVNNHQLEFARAVSEKFRNILVVDEISELKNLILNYDIVTEEMSRDMVSNNNAFNKNFEDIVFDMFC